jgi:hypothetical protein
MDYFLMKIKSNQTIIHSHNRSGYEAVQSSGRGKVDLGFVQRLPWERAFVGPVDSAGRGEEDITAVEEMNSGVL